MKYLGLILEPPEWATHVAMDSVGSVYAYDRPPKRVMTAVGAGYWLPTGKMKDTGKIKYMGEVPVSWCDRDTWYFSCKEIYILEK